MGTARKTDRRSFEIVSVFDKWLGRKARELATEGTIQIVEVADFPEGAPIHEDGSAEYDPMKPLVLFAVMLSGTRAKAAWAEVTREFDRMVRKVA